MTGVELDLGPDRLPTYFFLVARADMRPGVVQTVVVTCAEDRWDECRVTAQATPGQLRVSPDGRAITLVSDSPAGPVRLTGAIRPTKYVPIVGCDTFEGRFAHEARVFAAQYAEVRWTGTVGDRRLRESKSCNYYVTAGVIRVAA